MKRDPSLLVFVAVLIGLAASHGGLWPGDRLLSLGFWTLAALACAAESSRLALRPALLLPVAASALSLALAPIPILGADLVLTTLALTILAIACADYMERDLVLAGVLLASLVGAVVVVLEVVEAVGMIGRPGLGAGAPGLMGGANVSGVAIALGIPAVLTLADRGRISWGAGIPVALLLLMAVLLTGSRTAALASLAAIITAAPLLPPRWRGGLVAGGAFLAVASAFLYLPKFLARLDPEFLTNAQRLSMIRGVFNAFLERPFFGHGPWSFPVMGQAWLTWPKWELHPHSFPLRILFESGMAGLAAWSLVAISVMPRRAGRADTPGRGFSRGLRPAASMALVIGVGSLTDDVLWLPALSAFFLACLAALLPPRGTLPRWAGLVLVATTGMLASSGPLFVTLGSPGLWPDPVGAIDRAIREGSAPDYRGAERDPVALRVRAWQSWDRGESRAAEQDLLRAERIDPRMVLGPHLLDLAWITRARGDDTAARSWEARSRELAPVLTARFLGESAYVRPLSLDWHYGIEFPRAEEVGFAAIPQWDDPLDWRHWRHRAVRAFLAGDRVSARAALAVAETLVISQYGRDPQLARIELALGSPAGGDAAAIASWEADLRAQVAARDGAAYPWRVFGPLIHRQPLNSTGENSPWWRTRCGPLPNARSLATHRSSAGDETADTGAAGR